MRKSDPSLAILLGNQLLDNAYLTSGVQVDMHQSINRNYEVLDKMLEDELEALDGTSDRASRKVKETTIDIEDTKEDDKESAMS